MTALAVSSRSAGLGWATRARRRRQSSACHDWPSVSPFSAGPRANHPGALDRVAVEQGGDVPDGAEPSRLPDGVGGVGRAAQVDGQRVQPRLAERRVDHLQQRPDQALGQPGVVVAVDATGGGDGVAQQPRGRGELDVRAHAVAAPGGRAERRGDLLRQPALHPAGGDGHDLGGERVRERVAQQRRERGDEAVGSFSSVEVKHDFPSRPAGRRDRRSAAASRPWTRRTPRTAARARRRRARALGPRATWA